MARETGGTKFEYYAVEITQNPEYYCNLERTSPSAQTRPTWDDEERSHELPVENWRRHAFNLRGQNRHQQVTQTSKTENSPCLAARTADAENPDTTLCFRRSGCEGQSGPSCTTAVLYNSGPILAYTCMMAWVVQSEGWVQTRPGMRASARKIRDVRSSVGIKSEGDTPSIAHIERRCEISLMQPPHPLLVCGSCSTFVLF